MSDIPIIFSAPMVLALLEGRKTQTRRLAWRTPCFVGDSALKPGYKIVSVNFGSTPVPMERPPSPWQKARPGDLLYVRENFAYVGGGDPGLLLYGATWRADAKAWQCDNIPHNQPRLRPCIRMPRKISRLTLKVSATKIEPLNAISEADAAAEGAPCLTANGKR